LRQPILYAEEMWRRQRTWVMLLVALGVVMSVFMLVTRRGALDGNSAVWLAYIPAGLLFGGVLLYYRWRNSVEVTDGGLRIRNLLSSEIIPYDQIRSARVQPLALHFQDSRKRYVRPISRPLMPKPALFVRVRGDETELARLRRKLGAQLVAGDTVALPIRDPDAMAWEVSSRLPARTGVNLGGQRRRKRTR